MLTPPDQAVTELGASSVLPRADAAAARALNRLYGASPSFSFEVRGRRHTLRWHAEKNALERSPLDLYRFRFGSHAGQLGLDAPSVSALLDERRVDLLPRELRYLLLADALQGAVDAAERALRLHFEWTPPEDDAAVEPCDPLRAAFFVATPADGGVPLRGYLQFEAGASFDTLVPTLQPEGAPATRAFDRLRMPVNFRLGHTQITLREVGSIRPGDIIGIESWASSGAALVVTAELGGAGGRELVGLAEGSRITLTQSRDRTMNRDTAAPAGPADDTANLPIDRLDALEVSLRFEVGDLSLSLGELRAIRAGHVFDLGQPLNRSPVRILAHGNVLGKGYLVAVGDRLGVRVSEFAPGEI
ncbi:type III secretion system cytoplasmic ring protein SctQ [Caldimonas brevitalea]|uniref:Type III secretion protein n=1 Tax=Caldimonas brevitalea TaxID=413882 RepID=A0A0G3BRP6_9BURK|nr:type III secretion system cytoplasmic ring protein SctQ [Caldimonas brevitalea]AKJ32087.1 type III secretion protein [Caldimonas brevitalea]